MIKIKAKSVDRVFRKVVDNGHIIVTAKRKDWEIPYTYEETSDSIFSDYDTDLSFEIPEALSKEFDEDTIDALKEEIEEEFGDLKTI